MSESDLHGSAGVGNPTDSPEGPQAQSPRKQDRYPNTGVEKRIEADEVPDSALQQMAPTEPHPSSDNGMCRSEATRYATTGMVLTGLLIASAILVSQLAEQSGQLVLLSYMTLSVAIVVCSWFWFSAVWLRWRTSTTDRDDAETTARRTHPAAGWRALCSGFRRRGLWVVMGLMTVVYVVAIVVAGCRFFKLAWAPCGAVAPPPTTVPSPTPTWTVGPQTLKPSPIPSPSLPPDGGGSITPDEEPSPPVAGWALISAVLPVVGLLLIIPSLVLVVWTVVAKLLRLPSEAIVTHSLNVSLSISLALSITLGIKLTFELVPELKSIFERTPCPVVCETPIPCDCTPVVVQCECDQTCCPVVYAPTCVPSPECSGCPQATRTQSPAPTVICTPTPTELPCFTPTPSPTEDP